MIERIPLSPVEEALIVAATEIYTTAITAAEHHRNARMALLRDTMGVPDGVDFSIEPRDKSGRAHILFTLPDPAPDLSAEATDLGDKESTIPATSSPV